MKDIKSVLILGLGITGISAAKAISKLGSAVYAYDDAVNSENKIPEEVNDLNVKVFFDKNEIKKTEIDIAMKSPGIDPESDIILYLKKSGIEVISDLELGYLFKNDVKLIAITGTNGKTTTTTLINEILNAAGKKSLAVGNIGVGVVDEFINTEAEYLVVECSSFQLEYINAFKPDISIFLNLGEDHLDHHKTLENYRKAKLNIFKNLDKDSYAIVNADDENLKSVNLEYTNEIKISAEVLDDGIFLKDGGIYFSSAGKVEKMLDIDKIKIRGKHNYYNIMSALAVSKILDLDFSKVKSCIYNFNGVKHRLQFIKEKKGIKYYNDSKGTNIDSTMKALDSFEEPVLLILGGYDKGEDFSKLMKLAKKKTKAIAVFGSTKEKILNAGIAEDVSNIYEVDNLKEAFYKLNSIAKEGDVLLLSPACASWDMYRNFEERGDEFISIVDDI